MFSSTIFFQANRKSWKHRVSNRKPQSEFISGGKKQAFQGFYPIKLLLFVYWSQACMKGAFDDRMSTFSTKYIVFSFLCSGHCCNKFFYNTFRSKTKNQFIHEYYKCPVIFCFIFILISVFFFGIEWYFPDSGIAAGLFYTFQIPAKSFSFMETILYESFLQLLFCR